MCGIVAIAGKQDVAAELAFALSTLQHRGQDAAGICCDGQGFQLHKGLGFVREVFRDAQLETLKGWRGIGHVRYATAGDNSLNDAQPVVVENPLGIALAHNGNLTNTEQLKQQHLQSAGPALQSSNDLELLLYSLAKALPKRPSQALSVDDIFSAVRSCQAEVQGAYAVVGLIAGRGLLGFCDPHAIRPLVLGQKNSSAGQSYCLASESTTLDSLGFALIRELGPGEAIFVEVDGTLHQAQLLRGDARPCVFENIYFAREDSHLQGRFVANQRLALGRALAPKFQQQGLVPDIVIDVPQSGYFFAAGLAEALGVPYRKGLSKNRHIGRSFISPTQDQREALVRASLKVIDEVVTGLKVAVVDDSIVRGTTSRYLVNLLRKAGAREVYLASASPPLRSPCVYGIDMAIRAEMVAAQFSPRALCRELGADALIYQDLEILRTWGQGRRWCDACFSGQYPTGLSERELASLEHQRQCSKTGKC